MTKRRGRKSLIEELSTEKDEEEELEKVKIKLIEVLNELKTHPYFWLVDYDIPPSNKKTFYRNLKKVRAITRSTRSVVILENLSEAMAIKKLAEACGGKANIYLTIEYKK